VPGSQSTRNDWIACNQDLLCQWWKQLDDHAPPATEHDFAIWCGGQYDIELTLRNAYRETHSKYRDL